MTFYDPALSQSVIDSFCSLLQLIVARTVLPLCRSAALPLCRLKLGSFSWALRLTTFYPSGSLPDISPFARCVGNRYSNAPLLLGRLQCNQVTLRARSLQSSVQRAHSRQTVLQMALAVLNVAPSGTTPSFRYRHKAIASRLATATIIDRLCRLPCPSVRRLNQALIALVG